MGDWKKLFDEYESAKKIWNSAWVGVPLWLTACTFTVYWLFDVPPPGFAIGALGTVAGIMSVRDIKTLGKVGWAALLVCFLIIEFRAIDKDRTANEQAQRNFFSEQRTGFEKVQKQAKTDFNTTAKGLQSAIGGLNTNIGIATKTLIQTRPHALLEFSLVYLEDPPLPPAPFAASTRYRFHVNFENDGTAPSEMLKRFAAIYIGKPDDIEDQKRIASRFERDWNAYVKNDHHVPLMTPPHVPEWWSKDIDFSEDQARTLRDGKHTVYFLARIEYRDQTGAWFSDTCAHLQVQSLRIDTDVFHACLVPMSDRHPVLKHSR